MGALGQASFRVGGSVGGEGWLLGSWNELSQGLLLFTIYYCQACGKFDLYYPGT